MTTGQTVLIAYNPRAGSRDRQSLLDRLSERLRQDGMVPCLVAELSDLQQRAAELQQRGDLRLVVAAGGDGTVAAVAERVAPETVIAVFPLGTENLLAKWLGGTPDIEPFCRAIARGDTLTIDGFLANGRLALITIGIGFDAEVVRQVHCNRRGHITKWNYAWPILRTFWQYRFPLMRVDIRSSQPAPPVVANPVDPRSGIGGAGTPKDGESWLVPWVFVANLPVYAGGLSLVPQANPLDGQLDIAAFSGSGRLRGLWYLLWIALRRHVFCRDYCATTARWVRIESAAEVGYQIDGDFGGVLPLEIEVQPGRVRLLRLDCNSVRF